MYKIYRTLCAQNHVDPMGWKHFIDSGDANVGYWQLDLLRREVHRLKLELSGPERKAKRQRGDEPPKRKRRKKPSKFAGHEDVTTN